MIFISHRGNLNGINPDLENSPNYIINTIRKGFDVEIDVWYTDSLYLGHDKPEYKIDLSFLQKYSDKLWCHSKNIKALKFLLDNNIHTFWHQNDFHTITSRKFIWTYPGYISDGILVLPENKINTETILKNKENIKGICSDYISNYKELLKNKEDIKGICSDYISNYKEFLNN